MYLFCVFDETYPIIFFSELDGSNPRGLYHVGLQHQPFHGNKHGDFLFSVPQWYADQYLGGRIEITEKSRGIKTGSMGPTLFAFYPWSTESPEGDLDAIPMLWYRWNIECGAPNVYNPELCDYHSFTMCDKWEGGGFLESGNKKAIILIGKKGLGENFYDEPLE
ncbi:MAG: hypothetical protein ACMUIP_04065 [bacterium]